MKNVVTALPAAGIFFMSLNGIDSDTIPQVARAVQYGLIFFCFVTYFLFNSKKFVPQRRIYIPAAIFVLYGMMSAFWSEAMEETMMRAFFNFAAILLACGVMFSSNGEELKLIVRRTFIAITIPAFLLLVADLLFLGTAQSYVQGNYRGPFYNSNYLGQLIGLICLPYLLIYGKEAGWAKKVLFLLMGLVFIHALLETRSRAAILSFVIFAFFIYRYYVFSSWPSGRILIKTFFIAGLFIMSVFLYSLADKYATGGGLNEAMSTRAYLWEAHMEAISKRPLLGWGLGINPVNFKGSSGLGDSEKGNSYIAIVEELGLVFLVIMTFMSLTLIRVLVRKLIDFFRKKRSVQDSDVLCFGFLCGSVFHVNFESWLLYFGNPFMYILLFCIAAVSARNVNERRANANP